MKPWQAHWDFPYRPSAALYPTGPSAREEPIDLVVATQADVDPDRIARALAQVPDLHVEVLIRRPPLFWTRVVSATPAARLDVAAALSSAGLPVRYVASAKRGTMGAPSALTFAGVPVGRAVDWPTRRRRAVPARLTDGHWFLGANGGVHVDRAVCGTGAGTRLAVIDDDAADFDRLELDRVVPVGVERIRAASGHSALMVSWAAGALRPDGRRFVGVAPDTSVRVYCPPKPDVDVVSLPLAIARAVFDGADVVLCAAYVDGTMTPMLDDALAVASRLGRRGKGAPVVLPAGRQTSSAGGSIHASLSLDLGDPASDPRVHCIAPGGRDGAWFLWRGSPKTKFRPFSNRGPAVRWMAPGDDVAYPFSSRDRLFHAESSGASAIAAGVLLLVVAKNPRLRLHEVHSLLARFAVMPTVETNRNNRSERALADPADLLPRAPDPDGHDAKIGYGRLNATRACAGAADPVALELLAIGEEGPALRWLRRGARPYSARLARWAARALLTRPDIEHALRVALRHVRLLAIDASRKADHAPGALARYLSAVVRELALAAPPPAPARDELDRVLAALTEASWNPSRFDGALDEAALAIFEPPKARSSKAMTEAVCTCGIES